MQNACSKHEWFVHFFIKIAYKAFCNFKTLKCMFHKAAKIVVVHQSCRRCDFKLFFVLKQQFCNVFFELFVFYFVCVFHNSVKKFIAFIFIQSEFCLFNKLNACNKTVVIFFVIRPAENLYLVACSKNFSVNSVKCFLPQNAV